MQLGIRLPERGADSPLVWYASGAAVSFECTPGNTRDGAWRFANSRGYVAGWGPLWAGCITQRSYDCSAYSPCDNSGQLGSASRQRPAGKIERRAEKGVVCSRESDAGGWVRLESGIARGIS